MYFHTFLRSKFVIKLYKFHCNNDDDDNDDDDDDDDKLFII